MARVKIDIEDLVVWALVRQCANVNRGQGIIQELRQLSGGSVSATGQLESFLSVGGRIDGGPGPVDHRTPADAIRVAAAVDRLPIEAAALVVLGTKSSIDWAEEGVGRWVAVLDKKGKHKKLWQDTAHARGLLGWDWLWEGLLPSEVDERRLEYWTWWHALDTLRGSLEGRMMTWEITGPRRSPEPWNDATKVIHWPMEGASSESIDVV